MDPRARTDRWIRLHGDDEDGEETGFHLVQNDGAKTGCAANNAVDTVADGIYHLGFEIDGYRFPERGTATATSVSDRWRTLNDLLADDRGRCTLGHGRRGGRCDRGGLHAEPAQQH